MNLSQQIPRTPLRFAWFVSRPYRLWFFLIIIVAVSAMVANAGTNYVLKLIVDSATAYEKDHVGTLGHILLIMLAYPAIILFEVMCYRISGMGLHQLTVRMRTRAYRILFDHLSLHSSSYFNDRFAGSLSSKVQTVGGNMSRLANDLIWSYLGLIVGLITSVVFIGTANLNLALAFVGAILIMIPFNYFLTKPQLGYSAERTRTYNKLRGQVVDTITNMLAVRHNAQRNRELARLDDTIAEHQVADIKGDIFGEKVLLINNLVIMLIITGMVFGAFTLWSQGAITLGDFIMIASIATSVIWSVSRIGQTMNGFVEIYGETRDSLSDILHEHDITDVQGAKTLLVTQGAIAFNNVSFAYENGTQKTFNKFSLSIDAGQRVGLVGKSGSGKSSLVKLLLREHDIKEGSIAIDEQNIREVTQDSLRASVAIVPQEPMLFHRSLKENIAYAKPDASEKEVVEAAKKAYIHDFIASLPEGYNTLVGERGVKLSGGQRQRVAIARAILKNAPILILDEATSSLDSESESEIQKALHELMQGRTVIAIAHRLSTIKEMDRIIVLEEGKVIEDGTHDELLQKEGLYARLWAHQAGGFLQED